MLIPALITAGILGALYVTRSELASSASASAPSPAPQRFAIGDRVEVPAYVLLTSMPQLNALQQVPGWESVPITYFGVRMTQFDGTGRARGEVVDFGHESATSSRSSTIPQPNNIQLSTPFFPLTSVRR